MTSPADNSCTHYQRHNHPRPLTKQRSFQRTLTQVGALLELRLPDIRKAVRARSFHRSPPLVCQSSRLDDLSLPQMMIVRNDSLSCCSAVDTVVASQTPSSPMLPKLRRRATPVLSKAEMTLECSSSHSQSHHLSMYSIHLIFFRPAPRWGKALGRLSNNSTCRRQTRPKLSASSSSHSLQVLLEDQSVRAPLMARPVP